MTTLAQPVSGPVIETNDFVAGYERDLPIVKGIDLRIEAGSFTAIFGPNGAGKSTFVRALAGIVPVFSGSARLFGTELAGHRPHDIMRRGMAFVPQTENVFTSLTIRENLQLAAAPLPKARRGNRIEAMFAMFPDLASRPDRAAGALSGGQRQMLAIARALLLSPSVLVLDEPSAGLSPRLVGDVFKTLERISATGVTILLVEQNVRAALKIVGRAVVLVDGQVRYDGTAEDLRERNLAAMFLGLGDADQRPQQ